MDITGYINRKGMQRKLIGLFLMLGLIPMIIMGSAFYFKSTTALVKNANAEISNLSSKAIELLDFQFAIYRLEMDNLVLPCSQVLDMLQFGMDVTGGNRDVTLKHFRDYMKAHPAYKRIRIIDEKGDETITTGEESADKKNNISAFPWFKRAFAAKEILFSEVHTPGGMNEPVIIVTKTMYSQEGKAYAVVAADISAETAMGRITTIKIGKEGLAYVVNGEGRVIAHPDKTKVLQVNLSAYDFGKEILQKKTGAIEYSWEGRNYLASFHEYPALSSIIISAANKEEILESANVMKVLFIILVGAMAIFSLVTGVIFTVRLVKPITRIVTGLSDGSDQVASASTQVSSSSQLLAEGASEQASSLEETSSSLEEMSSMTKQNADNANHAKAMMNEAKAVVEKANVQMAQLTEAIGQITRSSEETGKIIKTIDEIA
ncbi:MAG: cache domain-containing protein, partial [Syntrophales bacterium]